MSEKETTAPELEAEETQVLDDSEEKQETSNTTEEPEEKAEAPEPESEDKQTDKEESFEDAVKRVAESRAQSIADKSNKTYQKQTEEMRREIEALKTEVNEKKWDRAINSLFDEESETKGEEEAAKNKAAREAIKNQVLEFHKNEVKVNKTLSLIGDTNIEGFLKELEQPTLDKAVTFLDSAAKKMKVVNELRKVLFPEDKAKVEKIEEYAKRFDKARDTEDFQIILEGIKAELKGGKKKFVPDSGKQGGATGDTFTGNVTQAQLDDDNFWENNKAAILKAKKEGKLKVT